MKKPIISIGSGNWAVKNGELLGYQEVHSNGFLPQILDSTRGSDKKVIGGDGILKSVGTEFSPEEAVSGGWALAGEATISNGVARIYSSAGAYSSIRQFDTITIGAEYIISFNVIATNGATLADNTNVNIFDTSTVGPKSFRITASEDDIAIKRNGGITDVTIDNISVKEVLIDTPAIDFKDDSNGVLLTDPQSTNLLENSETFADWTENGTTVISTTTNSNPEGELSSQLLSGATDINWGSGSNALTKGFTVNSNSFYTFSVYVKSLASTSVNLQIRNNNTGGIDNVATSLNLNEWKRVSITIKATATQTAAGLVIGGTDGDILIWGSQFEAQPRATSYIKTIDSIATRLEDTVIGRTTDAINSEEGVLYFYGKMSKHIATYSMLSLHNAANNGDDDVIAIGRKSDGTGYFRVIMNNISVINYIPVIDLTSDFNKIAIKYKSGNSSVFVNGVEVANSTTTFSGGLLELFQFQWRTNSFRFAGETKEIQVYDYVPTYLELIELTTL
tara:strand:+ start:991 stop:2508 length:1518 start_codon:yes stop_codon:yes gene_type:complete